MVLHTRVVTGAGGGPDKTILNSPRFLRAAGYDSACAFLRTPGDEAFDVLRRRGQELDAPVVEIDDRGPLDWRIVPAALEVCRRLNVHLWHAHDYKTNLLGLLIRRRRPMKLVTTVHGWVEFTWRTRIYHAVDRFTLPRYDQVVCVSPDLAEQCRRLGVRPDRLTLIENAIDCDRFRRSSSVIEAKRRLEWPTERRMIFAAGRLSPEKGFDRLIDAAARLASQGRDVGVAIAGEGVECERLLQQSRAVGLENRVQLLGFQNELRPFYEAADLFALSSLREGLPNVVLEAMSMQTPVVATRVAGVPKLIEHGQSGLLVEIGDAAGLTGAIERLLDDSALAARLAAAGRRVIEDRYSFAARMKTMTAMYESIGLPAGSNGKPS